MKYTRTELDRDFPPLPDQAWLKTSAVALWTCGLGHPVRFTLGDAGVRSRYVRLAEGWVLIHFVPADWDPRRYGWKGTPWPELEPSIECAVAETSGCSRKHREAI